MSAEKQKYLIFRGITSKSLSVIIIFLTISVLIQYFITYAFSSMGLIDQTFLQIFKISSTSSITISPLYHLIPIGVIITLISSWMYLAKQIAKVPYKQRQSRKKKLYSRKYKKITKKRFRSIKNIYDRINKNLIRTSHKIVQVFRISHISDRLAFARTTIKSAVMIFMIFLHI